MVISSGPFAPAGGADTKVLLGRVEGTKLTVVDDEEEIRATAGNIKRTTEIVAIRIQRDERRVILRKGRKFMNSHARFCRFVSLLPRSR